MEIKTKYNIGDKVWVMNCDDEPVEFIIACIEIRKSRLYPILIFYSDDMEEVIGYWEERVFPTKEELLKSL